MRHSTIVIYISTSKRCPSCGRDTGYGTFESGDCPYCGYPIERRD